MNSRKEQRTPGAAAHGLSEAMIMTPGTVATRANLDVLEAAYQRWRHDPDSVDESWRYFFEGFELWAARPAQSAPDARPQTAFVPLSCRSRAIGHFPAPLGPL